MNERVLRVRAITQHGPRVKAFVLEPIDGTPLPSHQPGAHCFIHAGNVVNAYSLLDDGVLPDAYRIAVQRMDRGGGSDWLHDTVQVGDLLTVAGPKATFSPVPDARQSLLVAAGIGITPILAHARAAARWARPFRVIYAHRDDDPPFLQELTGIAGSRLTRVRHRDDLMKEVSRALRSQPVGSHAWACGPRGLLDWFLDDGAAAGWVPERLHVEPFEAAPAPPATRFAVVIRSTGARIDVPANASLLTALDAAGISLPRMCTRGVCGECEIGVRRGTPDHRDLILSREQRASGAVMYPCVSRALTPELEIEL